MIGAIANPTKKVTIDFPISRVKDAVRNISKVYKKYTMEKENPMFNQFTLQASEFLSLGVFIDINLSEQGDNRTEINIEIRRKMGAFDEWIEVQNANQHIQNIIDALSRLLTNPNVKVQEVKQVSKVPEIIGYIIGICILIAILN
jgi:hypothetical protein